VAKSTTLDLIAGMHRSAARTGEVNGANITDPAILGASRKKNGNIVILGLDPSIAPQAQRGFALKLEMEAAAQAFNAYKAELATYGTERVATWNSHFSDSCKSALVPFTVVQDEQIVTLHVRVTCVEKYSVKQEQIVAVRPRLGEEAFALLFVETTTHSLKEGARDLVERMLIDLGVKNRAERAQMMANLIESETTIAARPDFDTLLPEAIEDEVLRATLKMAVTKQTASVHFPEAANHGAKG